MYIFYITLSASNLQVDTVEVNGDTKEFSAIRGCILIFLFICLFIYVYVLIYLLIYLHFLIIQIRNTCYLNARKL